MNSPAVALLVTVAAILQAPPEGAAISEAKNAIVRDLDNVLAPVRFETWLRGLVGPQAEMKWEVNDCGEQTGTAADPARDLPMCAGVQVGISGGRRLSLALLVGSQTRGVTVGPLRFYQGSISGPKGSPDVSIVKLSELPPLLGRPNAGRNASPSTRGQMAPSVVYASRSSRCASAGRCFNAAYSNTTSE
jgi:hypothetical protein